MSMFPSQLQDHDDFVVAAVLQDAKKDVVGKNEVGEVVEDQVVVIQGV